MARTHNSKLITQKNGYIQATVLHQGRFGLALQSPQRDSHCHPEPLPMDEAQQLIDGRTRCHRIQQVPPFVPETGSTDYRQVFGGTLILQVLWFVC